MYGSLQSVMGIALVGSGDGSLAEVIGPASALLTRAANTSLSACTKDCVFR